MNFANHKLEEQRHHDSTADMITNLLCRHDLAELETPSALPKMPAGDHLANHGIMASPNWLEAKNPRKLQIIFRGVDKKFGDPK